MPRKTEKQETNLAFLKRSIELLEEFSQEFDDDDADQNLGLLKTVFSTLMNEGYMDVRLKGFGLKDLVVQIFEGHASENLLYRAGTFDELLDTYIGEPSDKDIEEAHEHLENVLATLREKLGGREKRKTTQETLWNKP